MRFWVPNFLAADISFETVILLGLLLGPGWAMLGGVVLAGPAVYHHEYLALPFNAALGLTAGLLGRFVEREEIWSFTPFIDLSLYRWVRRNLRQPRVDRQIPAAVSDRGDGGDAATGWPMPIRTGCLRCWPSQWWVQALVWLSAPIDVGIALKVWNALRIELKLEEQKRLLLEARLDALAAADQSALSLQHAQLHCLAGAHEAGDGATDDGQARQHSARAAQGPRHLRSAAATS